ncbi:hypothetical protein CLI80_07860 [Porphyromonas gingivalis]|nr:hypothetical protein CLI80_07860 [Porphyromonas gingivalis]
MGGFFFCIRQGAVALIIRQLFFQSLLEEGIDRREKTPQPAPVQAEERRILGDLCTAIGLHFIC